MSDLVRVHTEDTTLVITLMRADRKNALTLRMYEQMTGALEHASKTADIRAVVVRGEGSAFCAGNDISDFANSPPDGDDHPVLRFLYAIREFDKPLIAAVHGWCVGIGTTMLLHCDLAYAASNARFKMPFTALALVPEAGSSLLVPRMVGHRVATELLLTGDAFDATKALGWGFVNEVLDDADAAFARAMARAADIAALPPTSVRLTKKLLKQAEKVSVEETMAIELKHFAERLAGDEFKEAVAAFFEKRKPDFSRFA